MVWVYGLVYLVFAGLIFYFDISNLVAINDFLGGGWAVGVLPVSLLVLVSLLLVLKIVGSFVEALGKHLPKYFGGILLAIYFLGSWFILGLGEEFPRQLEEHIAANRATVQGYFERLNKFYNELSGRAEIYQEQYQAALKKLEVLENSPRFGGCGFWCKKYRELRADARRHWAEDRAKLRRLFVVAKELKEREFDRQQVTVGIETATIKVDETNAIVQRMVSAIDSAANGLLSHAGVIAGRFSVAEITLNARLKDLQLSQAPPQWPAWKPLPKSVRKALQILRNESLPIWSSLAAVGRNIGILLILMLMLLTYALFSTENYTSAREGLLDQAGEIAGVLRRIFKNDSRLRSGTNRRRWENHLDELEEYNSLFWKICRLAMKYSEPAPGCTREHDVLLAICRTLLDSHATKKWHPLLKKLITIENNGRRVVLEASIVQLLREKVARDIWVEMEDFNTSEMVKVLKKQLGEPPGGVSRHHDRARVPLAQKQFIGILNTAKPVKESDMVRLSLPYEVENEIRLALLKIQDTLSENLRLNPGSVLYLEDGSAVIHKKVRSLLRDGSVLDLLFEFSPPSSQDGNDGIRRLLDIGKELDSLLNRQKRRTKIVELERLEHMLDECREQWKDIPEVPVRVWKEIARAYTHCADASSARRYIGKIEQFVEQLPEDKTAVLTDLQIETSLVVANMLADELCYDQALGMIDELLDRHGRLETPAVWKTMTAKGHILAIHGKAGRAVECLLEAVGKLETGKRLQAMNTLARAYINLKNAKELREAEKWLAEVKVLLDDKTIDEHIVERGANRLFMHFEKVRLNFVKACRSRSRKAEARKAFQEEVQKLKELTASHDEREPHYTEVLTKSMEYLLAPTNGGKPNSQREFYLELSRRVTDNGSPPNILSCLYALATVSWLTVTLQDDGNAKSAEGVLAECKKWESTLEALPERKPEKVCDYLQEISSLVPRLERREGAVAEIRKDVERLLGKAEYLPAILPRR